MLHEPGWSAGGHSNNTTVQSQVEPIAERAGVAIVFAGHNHYYARGVVHGVEHVTTGGAGAPLSSPSSGQPNIVATASGNHYCKIEIDNGALHFRAVSMSGALLDSFTLTRAVATTGVGPSGPAALQLERPSPNPGRGSTLFRFSLPAAGRVQLEVVDVTGRRVWSDAAELGPGAHQLRWDARTTDGTRVGSGLYFVRLVTPWGTRSTRLTMLR